MRESLASMSFVQVFSLKVEKRATLKDWKFRSVWTTPPPPFFFFFFFPSLQLG